MTHGSHQRPNEVPKYRRFDGKRFAFSKYRYGPGAKRELQAVGDRKKNAGKIAQYRVVKYKGVVAPTGNGREPRTVYVLYTRG